MDRIISSGIECTDVVESTNNRRTEMEMFEDEGKCDY